jgi:tRNA (guanine37-N1)-methyltransferase
MPQPLRIDVVSLFPAMFDAITQQGVSGRAIERALFELQCWNPREQTDDAYRRVDDRPFGGGPGMVMLAQPLASTLDRVAAAQHAALGAAAPVIYLSPRGRPLDQARICALAQMPALTLLCGRYEGIDERLLASRVHEEVAVGDFVVSGGELPAMMLIDAVVRWLPGALNDAHSALQDSFAQGLLDCPHYTRPELWNGMEVPEVLLGGHHQRIHRWRREQALESTLRRRPDLITLARARGQLDAQDERFLAALVQQVNS